MDFGQKEERLSKIAKAIRVCKECSACEGAPNMSPVGFKGSGQADVMFVGRSPEEEEAVLGEPFSGSNRLEMQNLLAKLGLTTEQVYITNLVKCFTCKSALDVAVLDRPPVQAEIDVCSRRFLDLEIAVIKPKVVVTIGKDPFRWASLYTFTTCSGYTGKPFVFKGNSFVVFPLFSWSYVNRRLNKLGEKQLADEENLRLYLVKEGIVDDYPFDDIEVELV